MIIDEQFCALKFAGFQRSQLKYDVGQLDDCCSIKKWMTQMLWSKHMALFYKVQLHSAISLQKNHALRYCYQYHIFLLYLNCVFIYIYIVIQDSLTEQQKFMQCTISVSHNDAIR